MRLATSRYTVLCAAAASMLLLLALGLPGDASARDDISSAVSAQMDINRKRYGIAGQAVYVARGEEILFRGVDGVADLRAHTPVTLDHAFPVYSLSKLLVSTLIMQLVETGDLDLDAPADSYVRDLPASWRDIPVRNFLNHTSGVPEYLNARQFRHADGHIAYPSELRTLFTLLADAHLQFVPGSETRYTQTNYLVLSELLATHDGKPYPLIAQERILQKLGMTHSWLGPSGSVETPKTTGYFGAAGVLHEEQELILPTYAYGHGALHLTLDDLSRFLQALTAGALVSKDTLAALWREPVLPNGRRGVFASGWEYGQIDGASYVGHDGGAKVRVRLVLGETSNDTPYLVAYLTNGSARNIWSSVLVDSVLAVAAPEHFPSLRLQEDLIAYAMQPTDAGDAHAQIRRIQISNRPDDGTLERTLNATGYMLLENLGADAAIRVFSLNTLMFPASPNVWDSLGEAYTAQGESTKAEAAYAQSRRAERKPGP